MIHDFIKMIDNIDFLYGFIYELSQDEYLKIKKFIDNNIDIIESTLAPMKDYFVSCKKYYSHYYCSCYYYHKKKLYVFFLTIDIKNSMKRL